MFYLVSETRALEVTMILRFLCVRSFKVLIVFCCSFWFVCLDSVAQAGFKLVDNPLASAS